MATQETQMLDDVIVKSRRQMLALGGAALAIFIMRAAVFPASQADIAHCHG